MPQEIHTLFYIYLTVYFSSKPTFLTTPILEEVKEQYHIYNIKLSATRQIHKTSAQDFLARQSLGTWSFKVNNYDKPQENSN